MQLLFWIPEAISQPLPWELLSYTTEERKYLGKICIKFSKVMVEVSA